MGRLLTENAGKRVPGSERLGKKDLGKWPSCYVEAIVFGSASTPCIYLLRLFAIDNMILDEYPR